MKLGGKTLNLLLHIRYSNQIKKIDDGFIKIDWTIYKQYIKIFILIYFFKPLKETSYVAESRRKKSSECYIPYASK